MESKVTIYDIARETNFSAVTVHRALNNKGRISPKTKQLILDTAHRLGYKPNPAAQGLRRQPIRLGAVLFCPVEEYVDAIIDGMSASAAELEKYNVSVDIRKIDYTSSRECLQTTCGVLRRYAEENYNGVILFMSSMVDEMEELSGLIRELTAKNIAVATVANDIPGSDRILHVGVDAALAGSMAAELLELTCSGKDVALLVTSRTSPINMEYINSFLRYAREDVFSSIRIYEHYDDKELVTEATKRMLEENPDLHGIYMTTASSALACQCIQDRNRQGLTVVTTDLLVQTPELLKHKVARATIFQNPYKQGKTVVRQLYNYITSNCGEGVHFITPHILLSSNVDAYLAGDRGREA